MTNRRLRSDVVLGVRWGAALGVAGLSIGLIFYALDGDRTNESSIVLLAGSAITLSYTVIVGGLIGALKPLAVKGKMGAAATGAIIGFVIGILFCAALVAFAPPPITDFLWLSIVLGGSVLGGAGLAFSFRLGMDLVG